MVAVGWRQGHLPILACAAWAAVTAARADSLGQWDGFNVRLDTAVRVSLGFRTEAADASLLANINADDGDRAFTPGPTSERVDVVGELSAERGKLGFDISAQGWYDVAYNTRNADTAPLTYNPINSSYRGFTPDVRALMGRQAELLNAYARDSLDAGTLPITVSIGRQTLLWGESLLFPENGIAAAQAPVDEIKSLAAPLAEAREVYLPVAQLVMRVGFSGGIALEFYDQLEWRRNRLPGVGSFFSTTDLLDEGGQRLLPTGSLPELYRSGDAIPHGVGQFGLALRSTGGDLDWGVYGLRADARSPILVLDPAAKAYHLDFPRGIAVFGASLSGYAGNANVAGEISVHHATPLDAVAMFAGPAAGSGPYAAADTLRQPMAEQIDNPAPILRGTTVNGQASISAQLSPGALCDGAGVQAEIAGNELVDSAIPPGRTAFAAALRAVATLQYFQVRPGLDVSVPVGLGIGLTGRSSVDASQNAGSGYVSAGLGAVYHVVWQGSLSFTHFVGGASLQPLADRDFATVSITRSF